MRQEVLNKRSMEANRCKARVHDYLRQQEEHFRKKRERERLRMRVALLHRLVLQQEKMEEDSKEMMRE